MTNSLLPVNVTNTGVLYGMTIVAIAAGNLHSLALCTNNTVVAWGYGELGQLGNNTMTNSPVPVGVMTGSVLSGKTLVAVAAGFWHNLALCSDGTLASWGFNSDGELGNNSTSEAAVPVLVNAAGVLSGKTVIGVAAGQNHSLALCSDGTMAAWGSSSYGQLGNNSMTQSNVPVMVNSSGVLAGKTVVAVAAGKLHNLALCSDGTLAAWGEGGAGQLGTGTVHDSLVPATVSTAALPAGARFMVPASGSSASYSLGLVALPPSPQMAVQQPAGTGLISGVSAVDFGASLVGTGVTKTFTILNNGVAQLTISDVTIDGANGADFTLTTPPASSVAVGSSTTFAVTFTPGAALTGRSGTLHIVSNDPNSVPFDVNLTGFGAGTVTGAYSTGLDVPFSATSFTATGSTVNFTLNYAPVTGTSLMVVNNTGRGFIKGVFLNLAPGQLVPLAYNGVIYNFVANYYGGTGNDLVLQWAGTTPLAWGYNSNGQLGNNSLVAGSIPGSVNTSGVLAGKTVAALVAGTTHSLALCADGTLATWGNNGDGELGNNSTTSSYVPVAVTTTGRSPARQSSPWPPGATTTWHCAPTVRWPPGGWTPTASWATTVPGGAPCRWP